MDKLPPHIVVFGPHANCTLEICPIESSVYGYRPSLPANVCLAVLFALAGTVHAYLGLLWRTWFFSACMLMGCSSVVGGYIARTFMYADPWNFGAFMTQILGVGMGPVFFSAAIYVTLSNAVSFLAPELSRFPPRLYYWGFLCCDIVSLSLQAAGAAMAVSGLGVTVVGLDLALGGLGFQLVTISVFCGLFVDFMVRFWRFGKATTRPGDLLAFFCGLGLALLLITVRSAYRLYELHEGFTGGATEYESLYIGMEGVTITIAVYSLLVGHPGLAFRRAKLGSESCVEMLGYGLTK
ncbi:RTA1 like protein-domain-containing protein [Xylariales sp. PMI_506]|nr:RTA1 like protein-domain-containing protein [Xylariales sp. PMI_506]